MLWKIAREGWRPALGWVGVVAVIHTFIVRFWFHVEGADPVQVVALVGMVLAQVGIRAVEKIKGQS